MYEDEYDYEWKWKCMNDGRYKCGIYECEDVREWVSENEYYSKYIIMNMNMIGYDYECKRNKGRKRRKGKKGTKDSSN